MTDQPLLGKAWLFGDDISTDHIAPGRLFHLRTDLPELAKHVLADARPEFAAEVGPGDFVVGGRNFGLGSSREHAPRIIKLAGVGAVLAQSFARIFFRNAINIGLPLLESAEASAGIAAGDEIGVDLETGTITDATTGASWQAQPIPAFMQAIFDAGGLVAFAKQRLADR